MTTTVTTPHALVLGAITVFIIERQLAKAAAFAAAGAALTCFGFMHGEAIGLGKSLPLASSYLGFAAVLLACERFTRPAPVQAGAHADAAEIHPVTA